MGSAVSPSSSPASAAPPVNSADASPVVAFDRVSLAFDEKVILDEVSFSLLPGRMKIILGPSGAGKSTILRLILGLLKPDGGAITVNGQRVDQMTEVELMAVRADVGMVFQEGALFDSLTVRENVGYRLFEETRQPLEEVDQRVAEVLGYVGLSGVWRTDAVRAVRRPAASRRDRPGALRQAAHHPLRRTDDWTRSDHGASPSTRRSSSCAISTKSVRSS